MGALVVLNENAIFIWGCSSPVSLTLWTPLCGRGGKQFLALNLVTDDHNFFFRYEDTIFLRLKHWSPTLTYLQYDIFDGHSIVMKRENDMGC